MGSSCGSVTLRLCLCLGWRLHVDHTNGHSLAVSMISKANLNSYRSDGERGRST